MSSPRHRSSRMQTAGETHPGPTGRGRLGPAARDSCPGVVGSQRNCRKQRLGIWKYTAHEAHAHMHPCRVSLATLSSAAFPAHFFPVPVFPMRLCAPPVAGWRETTFDTFSTESPTSGSCLVCGRIQTLQMNRRVWGGGGGAGMEKVLKILSEKIALESTEKSGASNIC